MVSKENDLGSIEISSHAISTLVGQVAAQTYGVVGLANPTRAGQWAATLTRDPHKGIKVSADADDHLTIEVYIIVKYGVNIASIANSLIDAVRYHVQTQTAFQVQQVNVHVQGLRMD
jgi:uncharacterized alkaline shock family protein YloU